MRFFLKWKEVTRELSFCQNLGELDRFKAVVSKINGIDPISVLFYAMRRLMVKNPYKQ